MRAELHRWSGLMRLVLRAWHAWHRLRGETLQKQVAALQNAAHRLSYRVWRGWRLAVLKRQRQRLALLQYAAALSARCFAHWRAPARRPARESGRSASAAPPSPRPRRARAPRPLARPAARRRLAHDEAAATAALGAAKRLADALTAWRAARVARRARRAVRARRAYLFMGRQLCARVYAAWRGLRHRRAALDAFVPRAAARLLKSRGARLLGRWAAHAAAAARVRQRAAACDAVAARAPRSPCCAG